MVSFNTIPTNLLTPGNYLEFDNSRAVSGAPGQPHRMLVIGQRLSAGSVAAGVPTQITNAAQPEDYFARGSPLAEMLLALKKANRLTECWAVALDDDAGGVAATGDPAITVTGTATEGGTIFLYVAGKRLKVVVSEDDTQNTVAAAIVAAINAQTDLPVTAAVDGTNPNEVDLTCKWKGETGNAIDLRLNYYQGESTPAGISVDIGAIAGAVSGTNSAPFNLEPGQTLLAAVDGADAETATFNATGAELAGSGGAFAAMAGETMDVQIGDGDVQAVAFGTEATQAEAIQTMNEQLTGCHVEAVDANNVKIVADQRGTGSRVRTSEVAAGITTKLGLPNDGDVSGTGNVADIDAVTHADAKSVIEAAIAGLTYTPASGDGVATLTSNTKGASSSIEVTGGTARAAFGFPLGLNSGTGVANAVLSGGSANPDIGLALAAIGATQYHTIIHPFADAANLVTLETELASRWRGTVQAEGQAFAGAAGTHAELATLGNSRNSAHGTFMGSGKAPQPPWIWAAVTGAVDAAEPDPARPRQTLVLPGLMPPADADRFIWEERNLLLGDGISTFTVDSGGVCRIERLVTTYQKNAQGLPDPSYRDVVTMRTLSYLRFSRRARLAQKYPRHKVADDGTRFAPGQKVVTPSIIKADALMWFRDMGWIGLVEGFKQFKAEYINERDPTDPNRINEVLPPDLINQLRVTASQIGFLS